MRKWRASVSLRHVKSPEPAATLPLAYAAEILFDLSQLRHECCDCAEGIAKADQLDEAALDECAQLDEALAQAQRILLSALKKIRVSRNQRSGSAAA